MKALLKILYFLLLLLIIFLLAGLFLPKSSKMESSMVMNASPEIVFEQVNNIKNWKNWSPWEKEDTSIQISYSGPDSGKDASYSFTSTSSGNGSITILESQHADLVVLEINFGENGIAKTSFAIADKNGGSIVTWSFENAHMRYFERYLALLFKKNMQTTFQKGLTSLREVSEGLRLSRVSSIEEISYESRIAFSITDSTSISKLDAKKNEVLEKLRAYLIRRNIVPTGEPLTFYKNWNPTGLITFSIVLPIAERTWGWNEYVCLEIPAGKALKITHWGLLNSQKPYDSLNQYMSKNGLEKNGSPWEIYISSPSTHADTSKWEKQVFLPVR